MLTSRSPSLVVQPRRARSARAGACSITRATAPECLLAGTSHAIGNHDRGRRSASASHPSSCQKRNSEPIRRRGPMGDDAALSRLASCTSVDGSRPALCSARFFTPLSAQGEGESLLASGERRSVRRREPGRFSCGAETLPGPERPYPRCRSRAPAFRFMVLAVIEHDGGGINTNKVLLLSAVVCVGCCVSTE
jgi:hypothetical protein